MWPKRVGKPDKEYHFTQLMTQYYPQIARFCKYRLYRQPFVCEEVVQDVFLTLYNKMDRLENHENLGGWLYKTADNLIKKAYQKLQMEEKHVQLENMMDSACTSCCHLVYEENFEAVEDREVDIQSHVKDIVVQLSEEDQSLWQAYYHEGASVRVLSRRMGLAENTVKSRVFRLKKRLERLVHNQMQKKDFAG